MYLSLQDVPVWFSCAIYQPATPLFSLFLELAFAPMDSIMHYQ
jgi:hypothetical protein